MKSKYLRLREVFNYGIVSKSLLKMNLEFLEDHVSFKLIQRGRMN